MEKALDSFSQAEAFVFLFHQAVLYWAFMLHKLSSKLQNYLQLDAGVFQPCMVAGAGHVLAEKKMTTTTNSRGDFELRREDLKMVMGLMGMDEGEEVKECWTSLDELSGMFEEKEPSLEEVKEAFSVFDENSDGFIDAVELQRVISKMGLFEDLASEACMQMIAAFDENKDGRIDFNEFVKLMERSFT